MRAAKLQELEEMGTRLQATAHALPSGPDRHNILQEIGRFRAQIIALQASLTTTASGLRTKEDASADAQKDETLHPNANLPA